MGEKKEKGAIYGNSRGLKVNRGTHSVFGLIPLSQWHAALCLIQLNFSPGVCDLEHADAFLAVHQSQRALHVPHTTIRFISY